MYTVKATAQLTGLTAETLRAWERRYAAVVPERDAKGRRMYNEAMLERLARLHRLTDRGHPISQIAPLDDAALQALLDNSQRQAFAGADVIPERMLDAVGQFRVDAFDRELSVAIATLPLSVLLERVVFPLLREIGQRWADGRLSVAQERLVSSLLRARLLSILSQHPRERAPRVLFATLTGEEHELGLLGAALQVSDTGVPLMYLGTEVPAAELVRLANLLGVGAVALSSVYPASAIQALDGVRELDAGLAPGIRIWLGGANAAYLAEELRSPRIDCVRGLESLSRLAARL